MTTVLVTGAAGTIGSRLLRLLQRHDLTVRALVRDPGRAPAPRPGLDVVVGDFARPASIRSALAGADAVFLLCGNVPEQVQYECTVIDEAARAGVGRIVKQSARGADPASPVAYWRWHALIEQHLEQSSVPSVVLRPSFLMTNLLAAADQVRGQGMLVAPAGTARISMIDPSDVAAVAAVALTGDGHVGHTYVLSGPDALDYGQVAAALTEVTGSAVRYTDVPPEVAQRALIDAGVPPFAAAQVVTVFDALRGGAQAATTDTVPTLLGRAAVPFAEFARQHAHLFRSEVTETVSA
jgi:uncharacterized protein YbjT (DUF2867 family)